MDRWMIHELGSLNRAQISTLEGKDVVVFDVGSSSDASFSP